MEKRGPGRPRLHTTFVCSKCKKSGPTDEFVHPTTCNECYTPRKPLPDEKECIECKEVKPIAEYYPPRLRTCKACYLPKHRVAQRKHRYGIDEAVFLQRWEQCGGRCELCFRTFTSHGDANVDHHHETMAFRGLLCTNCNTYVGQREKRDDAYEQRVDAWIAAPGTVYDLRKRRLTEDEKRYIGENPDRKSVKDLAKQFERTTTTIHLIQTKWRLNTSTTHPSETSSLPSESSSPCACPPCDGTSGHQA